MNLAHILNKKLLFALVAALGMNAYAASFIKTTSRVTDGFIDRLIKSVDSSIGGGWTIEKFRRWWYCGSSGS